MEYQTKQIKDKLPTFGIEDEEGVVLVTENEDGELEFPQAPTTNAVLN